MNVKKVAKVSFGMFSLLLGVAFAIQACVVRHYYDGNGVLYYWASLVLLVVSIILWRNDTVHSISFFAIYISLVAFLSIGFHVEPHVSSDVQLSSTHEQDCDAPHLLEDDHVYCSPFTGCEFFFACLSHNNEIHRTDRCIHCGRSFADHYPILCTIQKWISEVAYNRSMIEMERL